VGLRIVDSFSNIKKKIDTVIAGHMNKKIQKNKSRAERQIKGLIRGWIEEQPEVASLRDQGGFGSLNAQFGLPPGVPDIAIEAIIQALIASIEVLFTRVDNKFRGKVEFRIRGQVILSILDIPEGTVITEKGADLNWLQWLLTRGIETVVSGYKYVPGARGRSGGGTMMGGSSFRVEPISFTGTVNKNFITRAFAGRDKELSKVLQVLLKG
jgi:hypothetical protein